MSKIFRLLPVSLLGLLCTMTGCRHVVDYKVTREDRAIMRHFPGNLRVAKFTDMAPKHPSINLLSDNEHWKTNALDVYRHHEYADGISRMVAKDLAGMGLFDHVLGPEDREPATDYVLMGTVWDFSAVGRWKKVPENVVIFSSVLGSIPGALISSLATSYLKTDIVTSVILTDIKIVNLHSGKAVWTCPPLRAGGAEVASWSKANPEKLAQRADEQLRVVVSALIDRLQKDAPSGLKK